MFPDGAEPRPENYQVWNFDFNGLLITFDQYQVMPYAYGPADGGDFVLASCRLI